jgi:hypothetical protein
MVKTNTIKRHKFTEEFVMDYRQIKRTSGRDGIDVRTCEIVITYFMSDTFITTAYGHTYPEYVTVRGSSGETRTMSFDEFMSRLCVTTKDDVWSPCGNHFNYEEGEELPFRVKTDLTDNHMLVIELDLTVPCNGFQPMTYDGYIGAEISYQPNVEIKLRDLV